MAACSEVEEKASFSKDSVPSKIFLEETAGRNELPNKLSDKTKEELNNMSENAFQDLLEDIVSYNKPMNLGHGVIKDLIKEVSEAHEKANVDKHSEYKHHKILLNDASNSSNHRTSDDKKKFNRNREDSKSAFNSDKNIQQSLSLQDLLSPDSKLKKSHKAQRTLSLSSEEAANVITDPLTVTFKPSKKSNKQSNALKNQSNRSNLNKSGSKADNSSFSSTSAESGQKRKYESLLQNSTQPYESLINECDIPLPEGPMPEIKTKGASSSPVEIEMEEIKSDKVSSKDEKNAVKTIEKSKNSVQQSSSKFYLDSNDVDGTTNCSIQFNSYPTTVEDQNGSQVNFPISWAAKPLTSFLGTLFEAEESKKELLCHDEKQYTINADINGNPFSRSPRPSLASIVSTTLLDYSNSTLLSENKNRKNKRLRNAVNQGVLSENIAGHRGEEDIDTLLQYINSSDKKGKAVKGSQLLNNNKSVFHENDKKKSFGKEMKSCHKNMITGVKKKLSRSNSMENLSSNNSDCTERGNALSYESNAMLDKPLKSSKTAVLGNSKKNLDINSNVENRYSTIYEKNKGSNGTEELNNPGSNFEQSSTEVSSFAADFYSTADVSSQTVEEAGFLIVKKKQRKKHQGKRSDSYRWRTTQNQRKKGIMLPLAESKCGKQDSRRKSTSSVPHSEHSSADNSDLDSVHSLPVRGSVPHPTQPHPHTTPSSSSSTPQASYADIARMPIPKLNSPSPCIITYSAQSSAIKQQTIESDHRKPENNVNNFPYIKRKVDVRECTPVVNKNTFRSSVVEDETPSDVKLRSLAKSTRECNTQTEPEPTDNENKSNESDNAKVKKADECSKNLCTVCLCPPKKNCSCSNKSQTHFRHKAKSTDIPPVIMDNMPVEVNTCNVSFGFGVEEVLQMAPSETSEFQVEVEKPNSEDKDCQTSEKPNNVVVNNIKSESELCKSSMSVSSKSVTHNSDLSSENSSQLRTICYGTGRNICYSETKVNTKKFNLSEITNYLCKEFQCIENELGVSSSKSNGVSSKVMYYIDSAEEA